MKTTPGFDFGNLDRQIADMFKCKPLPEYEVKVLCEKVCPHHNIRPNKYLDNNPMLYRLEHPLWFVGIFMVNFMI